MVSFYFPQITKRPAGGTLFVGSTYLVGLFLFIFEEPIEIAIDTAAASNKYGLSFDSRARATNEDMNRAKASKDNPSFILWFLSFFGLVSSKI